MFKAFEHVFKASELKFKAFEHKFDAAKIQNNLSKSKKTNVFVAQKKVQRSVWALHDVRV